MTTPSLSHSNYVALDRRAVEERITQLESALRPVTAIEVLKEMLSTAVELEPLLADAFEAGSKFGRYRGYPDKEEYLKNFKLPEIK